MVKINKSEQVVLDALDGVRHWRELYTRKSTYKKIYENAIVTLKRKGVIFIDKYSILKRVKNEKETN